MPPSFDRPGLLEVARKAGVSAATVSRVLNNSPLVKAETRARIQKVVEEMRYMRNGAASALASRRSRTIGLIVPLLGTAVFAEASQSVQTWLRDKGYSLLVSSTLYDLDQELEAARTMIERGVDGLILVGTRHHPQLIDLLTQAETSAVQIFTFDERSGLPCVGFDNFQASYDIAKYLIDMGHKDIAVLRSHSRNNDRISSRFDGILACLRDYGLSLPQSRIAEVGFTIMEGRAGLRDLLSRGTSFSAVACTGDVIAVGALFEARAQGIVVPDQLSITGFHDLDLASQIEPTLTTIHVPIDDMAKTAVQLLLSKLNNEAAPAICKLETSIVVRKSVARPQNKPV